MRRIVFVLVAVAALAGVVAYMAPASGQADGEAAPIFGVKTPARISRLEVDLRGPRRRQPQRFARHSGQRCSDQGLPGREASIPGRHNHCPARLELRPVGGKRTKPLAVPNLSWPGHPRTGFSSWSRTRENTPRPAAGGSLNLTTANPPTRRCTTPAFPATRSPKLATLSSTVTHLEGQTWMHAALAVNIPNCASAIVTTNEIVDLNAPKPEELDMSNAQVRSETAIETPRARRVDMKLEVVVIPVSDVDRAKRFYGGLGWRLDADFVVGDTFRGVQFTPPGSPCSIHFGTGITSAVPGSAQRTLSRRVRHRGSARRARRSRRRRERSVPPCRSGTAAAQRPGSAAAQLLLVSPRSAIRTATAGCCRRSPCDSPDGWTQTTRHSPRRLSSRARSDVRRPRTASTRSGLACEMRTGPTGTPSTWWRSRPASRCRHEQRLRHSHKKSRGMERSQSR